MEITKKQIEIIHIYPQEGYYLTQANRKEDEQPIMSKDIMLSLADKIENWKEVTIEEGDRIVKEWEDKYLPKDNIE